MLEYNLHSHHREALKGELRNALQTVDLSLGFMQSKVTTLTAETRAQEKAKTLQDELESKAKDNARAFQALNARVENLNAELVSHSLTNVELAEQLKKAEDALAEQVSLLCAVGYGLCCAPGCRVFVVCVLLLFFHLAQADVFVGPQDGITNHQPRRCCVGSAKQSAHPYQ
jgi:hypothetical protein